MKIKNIALATDVVFSHAAGEATPPPLLQQIQTKSADAPLLLRAVCNGVEHTQRDNGIAPPYSRVPVRDAAGNAIADFRYTYFHNDQPGTAQRLIDKAGNLLWSSQYDAYGKAVVRTTASAQLATINPLRQPGQYLDAETGLHYNDRRCYDAETSRYVSRDPIGFKGGINLYGLEIDG